MADEKVKEVKEKKAPPAGAVAKKGKRPGSGDTSLPLADKAQLKVSPSKSPRLYESYKTSAIPSMQKQFNFKSSMQVPRIQKVVLNCAVKEAVANPKLIDTTFEEIMAISGQRPVITRARKSEASFKVRKGNALGVKVTLRRARMWEFLDRLINVSLPRVRDFKGISPKGFDGRGNFSLGIREQIIFPEINYDKIDKIKGLTITIATTARNNEESRALLNELGMPFRK